MNSKKFSTLSLHEKEELVFEEIGRCLIHIQTGLFSASRSEVFHVRFIEFLIKSVSDSTPSIAVSLRKNGFYLLINPHFFLVHLSTTEERSSALRHAENHLFLMHPFRQWSWKVNLAGKGDLRLFQICAALESAQFMSGYSHLTDQIRGQEELNLPHAASAESLYEHLLPQWEHLNTLDPSKIENPLLKHLSLWKSSFTPQDHSQWIDPSLASIHISILRKAFDRLLIQIRESLTLKEKDQISSSSEEQFIDKAYQRQKIQKSENHLFADVEEELSRTLIRMSIKDPFYASFLSGCVRQLSNQVPTAGVGFTKGYLVLYINPHFFMNELESLEERAAVLKHEALHIILKHLFQIQRPEIKYKDLYNIAADLEVNQYIGHPWSLPKGAILLSTFKELNLPPNEIAETYYTLLLNVREKGIPKEKNALDRLLDQELNDGKGHSDHRGWNTEHSQRSSLEEGEHQENSKNGNEQSTSNLTSLSDTLDPIDHEAFELEVEQKVEQAVNRLSSKDRGTVPGNILTLIEEWKKKRAPKVDWKKELRLFVHTNLSHTRKRTVRKKNKRYTRQFRQFVQNKFLTADALHMLIRQSSEHMPALYWNQLTDQHWEYIHCIYPGQRSKIEDQDQKDHLLDWNRIGRLALHHIYHDFQDGYTWPTWDHFSDRMLANLRLFRTPLDPRVLPMDIWIRLAKQKPTLLPPFSWDLFTSHDITLLKKQHPILFQFKELVWSMVPNEVLIQCVQKHPHLFNLTWDDLPVSLLIQLGGYQMENKQPYRIDRLIKKQLPGTKKTKLFPKLLVMIDTSGSVGDYEIELLFAEIDGLYKMGVEIYIIQVDTRVQLYYPYTGQVSVAGRGGTDFNPALEWLNQAREGVDTPTLNSDHARETQQIKLKVDGALYLTDGYASTPEISPYCRLLWVITPSGTDEHVKDWVHTSKVIHLPPSSV